jgi:hypothetical protein
VESADAFHRGARFDDVPFKGLYDCAAVKRTGFDPAFVGFGVSGQRGRVQPLQKVTDGLAAAADSGSSILFYHISCIIATIISGYL